MCGAPAQTRAGLEKDEDGGDAAGDAKEEAPIDLCGPDADAEEMEWEEAAPPPRQPAGNVAAGGANVIDLCDSDEPAEEEWEDADRPYARAGAGAAGAVEVRLTEDGEEACAVAACTPRKPSQRRANAGLLLWLRVLPGATARLDGRSAVGIRENFAGTGCLRAVVMSLPPS